MRDVPVSAVFFVLPAFPFAKLRWFFRYDRDAQQNRKKPAIRHDRQPTSNSGDNEIFRFASVGMGSLGATPHRRKGWAVFRRPPEA
ncbi:MAG: hypothetical protein MUF25_04755 [Pirellulaceae bacterium]|jgi:hypothetical protein|nr:hypothetical protein [Pirellulaceae bacterium]